MRRDYEDHGYDCDTRPCGDWECPHWKKCQKSETCLSVKQAIERQEDRRVALRDEGRKR